MRLLLIILLIPLITFSQVRNFERGGFSNISTGATYNNISYTNLEGIEGHQYLFDSWAEGTLIINDTVRSFQSKLQYDLVAGDLILGHKKLENKGFIIEDNSVTGFVINNKANSYHYVRKEKDEFQDLEINKKYFINPSESNDHFLIIDLKKTLSTPNLSKNNYSSINNNKKYKESMIYYILGKDKKYIKLYSLRKNQIIKVLSDKEDLLKKYINQYNLNLKKEKDVIKLLSYYHSN